MATITGFAGGTSDADWAQVLKNNELNAAREQQAKEQARKLGRNSYSWRGVDGASGFGFLPKETSAANTANNAVGGGLLGSANSSNNLLSSLGIGQEGGLYGSLIDSAKDMARFRLGLDQEQARFSRGLREEEAQSNFGRTTKLTAQQLTGQQDLEGIRQNAMTQRNDAQLQNNLDLLNTGNNFNLLVLGKNRAAALRGLR